MLWNSYTENRVWQSAAQVELNLLYVCHIFCLIDILLFSSCLSYIVSLFHQCLSSRFIFFFSHFSSALLFSSVLSFLLFLILAEQVQVTSGHYSLEWLTILLAVSNYCIILFFGFIDPSNLLDKNHFCHLTQNWTWTDDVKWWLAGGSLLKPTKSTMLCIILPSIYYSNELWYTMDAINTILSFIYKNKECNCFWICSQIAD